MENITNESRMSVSFDFTIHSGQMKPKPTRMHTCTQACTHARTHTVHLVAQIKMLGGFQLGSSLKSFNKQLSIATCFYQLNTVEYEHKMEQQLRIIVMI